MAPPWRRTRTHAWSQEGKISTLKPKNVRTEEPCNRTREFTKLKPNLKQTGNQNKESKHKDIWSPREWVGIVVNSAQSPEEIARKWQSVRKTNLLLFERGNLSNDLWTAEYHDSDWTILEQISWFVYWSIKIITIKTFMTQKTTEGDIISIKSQTKQPMDLKKYRSLV